MIIVQTAASRFNEEEFLEASNELLLERVGVLENNLLRVCSQFERILSIVEKQTNTARIEYALVEALVATLQATGAVDMNIVSKLWNERLNGESMPDKLPDFERATQREINSQAAKPTAHSANDENANVTKEKRATRKRRD